MEIEYLEDANGNPYVNVGNLRLTFIVKENRTSDSLWSGTDVLRIQAYKGEGNSLHIGAEFPVNNKEDMMKIIFEAQALYLYCKGFQQNTD